MLTLTRGLGFRVSLALNQASRSLVRGEAQAGLVQRGVVWEPMTSN